ncbi:MAG: hypothetical protein LBB81_05270 [Treponema sp.]|jgi:hypothetical protein|nr:hypothetical protein [Treponema sp.]
MKRDRRVGIKYLYLFLMITITVLTACADPIGNIGGSGSADSLLTVPNRVSYELNELFLRNNDLQVFISYQGVVRPVPVDLVEIGIAEDPDYPDELEFIPLDDNYALNSQGRKLVVVEYNNLSARYSIEVRDPYGLGGSGGGSGSGTGIIIEWIIE